MNFGWSLVLAAGSSEGGRRTRMSFGVGIGVGVEVARWMTTVNKADRRRKDMAGGRLSWEAGYCGNSRKEPLLECSFHDQVPKERDQIRTPNNRPL